MRIAMNDECDIRMNRTEWSSGEAMLGCAMSAQLKSLRKAVSDISAEKSSTLSYGSS
jgi:hypothetical protein